MGQIDDRVPLLVDLVEDVVTEQLDNVPVARFGPPRFPRKPAVLI